MEVRMIGAIVHQRDKLIILLLRGLKAEGVDAPFIGDAHKLGPASTRKAARRQFISQVEQMCFVIAAAQLMDGFSVGARGDRGDVLDGIEVWNQRHHDPVVPFDALIARDYTPLLASLAAAQLDGRFGADALKIYGIMPSRV